jgi:fused signal recognition particle receptor
MLKFWKKKPADKDAEAPATTTPPVDAVAQASDDPVLREALAETPSPADSPPCSCAIPSSTTTCWTSWKPR